MTRVSAEPMNSGKEVEQLVQEIERSLLSTDFEVTANKTVFDDVGDQLAEFDYRNLWESGISIG